LEHAWWMSLLISNWMNGQYVTVVIEVYCRQKICHTERLVGCFDSIQKGFNACEIFCMGWLFSCFTYQWFKYFCFLHWILRETKATDCSFRKLFLACSGMLVCLNVDKIVKRTSTGDDLVNVLCYLFCVIDTVLQNCSISACEDCHDAGIQCGTKNPSGGQNDWLSTVGN